MEIPPTTIFWGKTEHEPLVLAIYLPMFSNQPWFCKVTTYLETFRKYTRTLFLENRSAFKLFKLMLRNIGALTTATAVDTLKLLNSEFSNY